MSFNFELCDKNCNHSDHCPQFSKKTYISVYSNKKIMT